MFGKPKESVSNSQDIRAFLEQGCDFEGKLTFTGLVRLNGRLKGDIQTNDVLIVGKTAVIEGNIRVGMIIVGGRIEGDIEARDRVEILPTGSVEGTLSSPILITHEGAQLSGTIKVIQSSRKDKPLPT